jgi:hypothetical protein
MPSSRLSDRAVADMIKWRAAAVDFDELFAGHSPRSGFATEGYAQGTPELASMRRRVQIVGRPSGFLTPRSAQLLFKVVNGSGRSPQIAGAASCSIRGQAVGQKAALDPDHQCDRTIRATEPSVRPIEGTQE